MMKHTGHSKEKLKVHVKSINKRIALLLEIQDDVKTKYKYIASGTEVNEKLLDHLYKTKSDVGEAEIIIDPLPLISATIYVTTKCNLRCDYCYVRNCKESIHGFGCINHEKIEKIIGFLDRYGIYDIEILGGEPTLCKRQLEVLVKKLSNTKREVYLSTNAFDPNILIKIINYIDGLQLSIHYPSNIKEILIFLKTLTEKTKIIDKKIVIAITYNRKIKEGELLKLLKNIIKKYGYFVKTILISQMFPYVSNQILTTSIHETMSFYNLLKRELKLERYGIDLKLLGAFHFIQDLKAKSIIKKYDKSLLSYLASFCSINKQVEILPNGDVVPCLYYYCITGYKYGNLDDSDFEIKFKRKYYDLLSTIVDETNANYLSCPFWDICKGGCPAYKLEFNVKGCDPRCPLRMK